MSDEAPDYGVTLIRSEDLVKTDLEMVCVTCRLHLCDVEDGDSLTVLVNVATDHQSECVGERPE